MKIDYDYVNKILKVFLNNNSLSVDWNLESLEINEIFIFHMRIMAEKGLISDENGNSSFESLNLFRSRTVLGKNYHPLPSRLTAKGHDFASAMNKSDVFSTIKEKFKDEGLSVVIDVAKQIANKKAKELLGLPE